MRAFPPLVAALGVAASLCTSSFQSQMPPGRGLSSPASSRAFDERLRVLVPAYFYPLPGSPWLRLSAAAAAHPGRIAAIGDPFNGPGPAFDASYDAVFRDLRASGGQVIGYVYTSYGARPLAAVQADIDTWYAWYEIDGIFVDEMDNTPGAHESYYRALYRHAKSHQPGALVVSNPGTSTTPSYLSSGGQRVTTTLCVFENGTGFSSWMSDPWIAGYARRDFYALPYGLGPSDWHAAVDHAYANHCGWVYVTDDVLPNPWDTLPAYFEALVDYVDASY